MSDAKKTPDAFLKAENASATPCPLSRTFAEPTSGCKGPTCPLWRWKPALASDPDYMAAIKRTMATMAQEEAEQSGQKAKPAVSYHKEAVANVMRNPEGHGIIRDRGFCGMGGLPT